MARLYAVDSAENSRHAYSATLMVEEISQLSSESLSEGAEEKRAAPEGRLPGFSVHLTNFDGPFDLLLQLISRHRMEITDVAIATVTDEFITFIRSLESTEEGWKLDQATEFLVVAATLLDLKAARLLPSGEVDDEEDLALLEARDLLFARLLQYRAFKEIARIIAERVEWAEKLHPRNVALDPVLSALLPEVLIGVTPERFAAIANRVLTPKQVPILSVDHLHLPLVSVALEASKVVDLLRKHTSMTFRSLVSDAENTMVVVARFLALLELFREGQLRFEQVLALGELHITWVGSLIGEFRLGDEFDQSVAFDGDGELGEESHG
jgi:segregation and condensation protein A